MGVVKNFRYQIISFAILLVLVNLSSQVHSSDLFETEVTKSPYSSFSTNKYNVNSNIYKPILYASVFEKESYVNRSMKVGLTIPSTNNTLFTRPSNLTTLTESNHEETNYIRAGMEISIFIGAGLVGYNYWQEKMQDDWEFDYSSINDYLERLFTTEHIKFDDNDIFFNWGHVYAGAFYHQVGRVNGFSNYESLFISMAASSFWEYAIEFREAVSINDQVMTGIGGPIMGETFHQMAKLLKRRSRTPFAKMLATYFQPIDIFENALDKKGVAVSTITPKTAIFSRYNDEKLETFSGIKHSNINNLTLIEFGLDGEIVDLPIKSEGQMNRTKLDTAAVEIHQKIGMSQEGLKEYYSFTKIVPSAFFSKNLSEHLTGYTMHIGPAAATEYNSRGFNHEQDFYAIVNLVGATIDITLYKRKRSLRMAFDIYGDFAFVRPYGTNQYFESGNDYVDAKTVLRKKSYYYAVGTSLRSRIEVRPTKELSLGLNGVFHKLNSFDEGSKDRHADEVSRSLKLKDRLVNLKAWASYKPRHRWKITGAIEKTFRSGDIEEIESDIKKSFYVSNIETTYTLHINYDIL